jgi:hypothetical protein
MTSFLPSLHMQAQKKSLKSCVNRLCEKFSPSSNQECALDDSEPYLTQSPVPGRRKDLSKHPLFAILPGITGRKVVMVGGGRCYLLLPAPDLVCRTQLQCCNSVSNQATSFLPSWIQLLGSLKASFWGQEARCYKGAALSPSPPRRLLPRPHVHTSQWVWLSTRPFSCPSLGKLCIVALALPW